MTELPAGIDFQGVHCYRSKDDPATFFYLPGDPVSEKGPNGKSTLSLWVSDQVAMLQLGVRWEANADLLESLRKYLAGQYPDLKPELIRLSIAPVSVERVTLDLGDSTGSYTTLASAASSNYPPFTTIFNLQLTAEQKTQIVAALNGREQFFTVSYHLSFSSRISAEVSLEGDVKADLEALGQNPSLADCQARVESALAEGRLTLRRSDATGVPDDLWQELERKAKDKAVAALLHMASDTSIQTSFDALHLQVSASQTINVPLPLERSTDVSTWFQDDTGLDHIRNF